MPSSALWAVDLFGRVFTLSTAGQHWEPCRDAQLEFKRVSAARDCCWGIACDHQVYVLVGASDVPIRCQEEAYENQVGPRGGGVPGDSPAPPTPGLFPPVPFTLLRSGRTASAARAPSCPHPGHWPGLHRLQGGFQELTTAVPPTTQGGRSLPFGLRFWWPSAHFLSWRRGEGPANPGETFAAWA